jgi:Ca2+-binding RTX toxin-like protein
MTIDGTAGGETLHGTKNDDVIHGYGGNDLIIDRLVQGGVLSSDRIYAGAGDDVIRGGTFDIGLMADTPSAPSVIDGGSGTNTYTINVTNDAVATSRFNLNAFFLDQVYLNHVQNRVFTLAWTQTPPVTIGSKWAEDFHITTSYDGSVVKAGAGNDLIYADKGTGHFSGGSGNDILVSSIGQNILVGGAGKDTFVFNAGGTDAGADDSGARIRDFDQGHDSLVIAADHVSFGALKDARDASTFLADLHANKSLFTAYVDYDGKSGELTYKGDLVTVLDPHLSIDDKDIPFV